MSAVFNLILFFLCLISLPVFSEISVSFEVGEAPGDIVKARYGEGGRAKLVFVNLGGSLDKTKPVVVKVYNLLNILNIKMETVVSSSGRLFCERDLAAFVLGGLSKGEPVLFVFEQEDKKIAEKYYCPYPFTAVDKKGHRIELFFLDLDASYFIVNLFNYRVGEKLKITSFSCSEKGEYELTNQKKNFIAICPVVEGRKSGPASYTVSTADSSLTVKYTWGKMIPAS